MAEEVLVGRGLEVVAQPILVPACELCSAVVGERVGARLVGIPVRRHLCDEQGRPLERARRLERAVAGDDVQGAAGAARDHERPALAESLE